MNRLLLWNNCRHSWYDFGFYEKKRANAESVYRSDPVDLVALRWPFVSGRGQGTRWDAPSHSRHDWLTEISYLSLWTTENPFVQSTVVLKLLQSSDTTAVVVRFLLFLNFLLPPIVLLSPAQYTVQLFEDISVLLTPLLSRKRSWTLHCIEESVHVEVLPQ